VAVGRRAVGGLRDHTAVSALAAFGAALLALRLSTLAVHRPAPAFRAWAAGLAAYAVAAAALAWGAAAGWDEASFRVYYLCGGLLTAPLLGLGSLLLSGRRRALAPTLVYVGLAAGVAAAAPVHGSFRDGVPGAEHFGTLPHVLAVAGNSAGTAAVLAVAAVGFRRRPVGNGLIAAGVAVAAVGSAAGAGEAATAGAIAAAAVLLYLGFVSPSPPRARARGAPRRAPGSA
jgi:hypothetical protein